MKVAFLGGRPAGPYFAISIKLRDAAHDERQFDPDPRPRRGGKTASYRSLLDAACGGHVRRPRRQMAGSRDQIHPLAERDEAGGLKV